jgi:hypothetical protein
MTTVVVGNNTGNDYPGVEDNELYELDPAANYAALSSLRVGLDSSGRFFPVIRFSGLQNIAAGQVVTAVTLSLFQVLAQISLVRNFQLKRLLRNWVESLVTWAKYDGSINWTTAGALSDGNDRSATISAFRAADAVDSVYKDFTGAQLTTDVDNIVNAAATNNGWHLGLSNEAASDGTQWTFGSSDEQDGRRPKLSVTYTALPAAKAIVSFRDTAGAGGTGLQRILYTVTFYGDAVTSAIAVMKQIEIQVDMPNAFTSADLTTSILAAVRQKATDLGFAVSAADIKML